MQPAGWIILFIILVFVAVEIVSLVRAIKDNNRFKKGDKNNGSNCDDRDTNSTSDH